MRASLRLLGQGFRITLFTRPGCSLCDTARGVLEGVRKRRDFTFEEIDIDQVTKFKSWYDFDVPVIHVEKSQNASQDGIVKASQKLMHRFSEVEVEKKMDEVDRET